MATFSERIAVTIDVVSDKATRGLKDFKTAVKDADGVSGKLKAGTKSLGDTFRGAASNPALLAGGITAAAGVALKAVDDFAALGVEVGQFSDATGLAYDDASRWIEVAGDLGIEADGLKGTIGKLNKNIDPELFKQLGIEIVTTDDGATDVNATFLNTIERLKSIKDPAEQARVAADLLGRGWQSSAELIKMSTDDIRTRLKGVSDEKVFDKKDVDKARKYRDVMDEAGDVMQDLALTIGENLLPVIVSVVDIVKPAAEGIGYLAEKAGELKAITSDSDGNSFFGNLKENMGWFITNIKEGRSPIEAFNGETKKIAENNREVNEVLSDGHRIWSTTSTNVDTVRDSLKDARTMGGVPFTKMLNEKLVPALEEADRATQNLDDQVTLLYGKLDEEEAWANILEKLWALRDGEGDAEQEMRDLIRAYADFIVESDKIPEKKKVELIAALNAGDIKRVQDYLDKWAKGVIVPVTFTDNYGGNPRPAPGGGQTPDGERATRSTTSRDAPVVVNMNVRQLPTERELTDLVNNVRRRQGPVI